MAGGSLWEKIDLAASDGGLASALTLARVHEDIIKVLKAEDVENLQDFAR